MTSEEEKSIRSLAALSMDLDHRIKRLSAIDLDKLPLEEAQQINGDLHVARRMKVETDKELTILTHFLGVQPR